MISIYVVFQWNEKRTFAHLADTYFLDVAFFNCRREHLPAAFESRLEAVQTPAVAVVRDDTIVLFDSRHATLDDFVRVEQFPAFTPISCKFTYMARFQK